MRRRKRGREGGGGGRGGEREGGVIELFIERNQPSLDKQKYLSNCMYMLQQNRLCMPFCSVQYVELTELPRIIVAKKTRDTNVLITMHIPACFYNHIIIHQRIGNGAIIVHSHKHSMHITWDPWSILITVPKTSSCSDASTCSEF